jgi:hypothetical protein
MCIVVPVRMTGKPARASGFDFMRRKGGGGVFPGKNTFVPFSSILIILINLIIMIISGGF